MLVRNSHLRQTVKEPQKEIFRNLTKEVKIAVEIHLPTLIQRLAGHTGQLPESTGQAVISHNKLAV